MKKFRDLFLCFLFYAFLGWVYEVLFGIFVAKMGFHNRGFMFGPYLPVFGALFIMRLVNRVKVLKKPITVQKIDVRPGLVFVGIMVVATVVELITSYLMEAVMGRWLWDYHKYALNFQGRIALSSSLRFGIGGTVLLYFVQPIIQKILDSQSQNRQKVINVVAVILAVLFAVDLLFRIPYGSNYTELIV